MAFLSFILMNITSVGFIICHDHLAKTLLMKILKKSVRDLIVHFVQVQLFAR